MACLVHVAVHFQIDPKIVAKLWDLTMKQVPVYQSNAPVNPPAIVSNLPATALIQNLKMLVINQSFISTLHFKGLKMLIRNHNDLLDLLRVVSRSPHLHLFPAGS
jgi:hypothetical protein